MKILEEIKLFICYIFLELWIAIKFFFKTFTKEKTWIFVMLILIIIFWFIDNTNLRILFTLLLIISALKYLWEKKRWLHKMKERARRKKKKLENGNTKPL